MLRAFGKARTKLRKADLNSPGNSGVKAGEKSREDFYETQARMVGEILNEPMEIIRERTERLIYRGWEPLFKKIRLFSHVKETLDAFKGIGIKLGLLSDFPPETKLQNLGLERYWDAVVCSELTGHLKPDAAPFLELARRMKMPADKILYVGNSVSYDIEGSRNAGMKTALIQPGWKKHSSRGRRRGGADFIFSDYRQLRDYVLG